MKTELQKSIGIDALVVAFFYFLIQFIQYIFINLSSKIDYLTLTNLQSILISNPEKAKETISHMATSYSFLGIAVLLTLFLLFFIYGLSRNYLWNKLNKKPFIFKNSWKWLILPFLFIILLVPYILITMIIKFLLGLIVAKTYNQMLLNTFSQIVIILAAVIFIYFVFATHFSFSKSRKAWNSVGKALNLINKTKKTLGIILLVAIIVNIILALITSQFPLQTSLFNIINTIVIILFFGWARIKAFHAFKKH